MESLLITDQNNAIRTNCVKAKKDWIQENSKCVERNKLGKLAWKEYKNGTIGWER